MGFDVFIGNLDKLGFFDFLLPFLLFMAIIYGILSKYEPFRKPGADGEPTVAINAVISIVMSFFIINYTPIGFYFTELFALMATVVAGILVLTIVIGMFGVDIKSIFIDEKNKLKETQGTILFIVAGLISIAIFLYAASNYFGFSLFGSGVSIDQDTIFTYIVLIGMGGVVYGIVKSGAK